MQETIFAQNSQIRMICLMKWIVNDFVDTIDCRWQADISSSSGSGSETIQGNAPQTVYMCM